LFEVVIDVTESQDNIFVIDFDKIMKPVVLYNLCDVLTSRDLLQSTQNVSIREQVIVFLQIIGQNQRFHFISGI